LIISDINNKTLFFQTHAQTSQKEKVQCKYKSLTNDIFKLLQHSFFLFIDILLKLQPQILILFCKFSCNSVITVVLFPFLM